jgi:hypothetical protein
MTHQAAIEVIAQKPQRFGKVNVGTVKGKVVIYAADLQGSKISWKIGGNWGSAMANANFTRFERAAGKRGQSLSVEIYVNSKRTLTKEIVVR